MASSRSVYSSNIDEVETVSHSSPSSTPDSDNNPCIALFGKRVKRKRTKAATDCNSLFQHFGHNIVLCFLLKQIPEVHLYICRTVPSGKLVTKKKTVNRTTPIVKLVSSSSVLGFDFN